MHGRRRPKPRNSFLLLGLALLAALNAQPAAAKELRRSMSAIRPLLMGDAQVAVGDESSVMFYNPAGLAWMEEASYDLFLPQFAFNDPVRVALVDPDRFSEEIDEVSEELENEEFDTLLGRQFFTNINIRVPMVILPEKGISLGLGIDALANLQILENRVVPLIRVEFFLDAVGVFGGFGKFGEDLAFGYNLKVINRRGVDRTYTAGDFIAGAEGGSLSNRPEIKDLEDGVSFTAGGVDLGVLYRFPFARSWRPRMGLSLLNIGGFDAADGLTGIEFGPQDNEFEPPQAGELPQINTIGWAVSPMWMGIRFTIALDIVDFSRTALPGKDFYSRTRLGTEIGFFPHKDGTARFAILAGLNGGHSSVGILGRIWIFQVGFGVYTVELGEEKGDNPDRRTIFSLGVRF